MARIVPAAEQQEDTIEGSTVMAVEQAEVITMTNLDTLGQTAVQFSQGVTGGGDGGGTAPSAPPSMYVAVCTAVMHDPALYYFVQPNGSWTSDLREDLTQAQADAEAHDDGRAYVCIQIGTHLVGPYSLVGAG